MVAGEPVWTELAFGLAVGMVMHIGLDLTNSYGVRCLWPFSSKRFALDWIFFIDAIILAYTLIAGAIVALFNDNQSARFWISIGYVAGLALIVAARAWMANRARTLIGRSEIPAASLSIIPTTWSPRKFLVCRDQGNVASLSTLDGLTGAQSNEKTVTIIDGGLPASVMRLREWTTMRDLSSFFHAVEYETDDDTIVCRDLRIRNFDTRFGTLIIRVDEAGEVVSTRWRV